MNTTPIRIIPAVALVLALAACQQQPKPAPVQAPAAALQEATPSTAPKAEAPAPQAPAPTAAKPSQPAALKASSVESKAPAPAKVSAPATAAPAPAKPAASAAKPEAATATFSTTRCMACHAIDHDKVGPAWKTVVEKYGSEAALAKDFETGFKQRRVANAIAKWKAKEGLMTMQYRNLIKGHEKEAAHALFETVKHGKFGSY